MYSLLLFTELCARAGGGGSGGSSSSGGGGSLLAFVFYFFFFYPPYKLSDTLRQRLDFPLAAGISIVATIIYSGIFVYLSQAVAGGIFYSGFILVFAGSGLVYGLGGVRYALRKKLKVARARHISVAGNDSSWDIEQIYDHVAAAFLQFQDDWSHSNTTHMAYYMHPGYHHHVQLMMRALKERGRYNSVSNVQIRSIDILKLHDKKGLEDDVVGVLIIAKADDRLIEAASQKVLHRNTGEFAEVWNFVRKNNRWLLFGIDQTTEDARMTLSQQKQFALENGFYYSPDWGSLLLPARGQLFRKGSFERSDINNHVIGEYHNILFELYTYIPKTGFFADANGQTLIAQTTLPKSYGKIVVQQRQKWWHLSKQYPIPKGLRKISMEGVSFDRSYQVFAENEEQVTSFELLDPAFMEQLLALPYKINIEVVDNVLYLYTSTNVSYKDMFAVLQRAFKNMRM